MENRLSIGMKLAAAVLFMVVGSPPCVRAAARIYCAEPVFNFGVTNSAALIKHSFELENTGDEPLQIVSVKCCCSASCSEPEKVLRPGQRFTLAVVLSLTNRSGVLTKRLYVRSSDPGCVILPLTIKGTVAGEADPAVGEAIKRAVPGVPGAGLQKEFPADKAGVRAR